MKWYSLGYITGLSSLNFIQSAEMVVWQLCICTCLIISFWLISRCSLINSRYLAGAKLLFSFVVGLSIAAVTAQVWLSASKNVVDQPQVSSVEGSICSIPKIKSEPATNNFDKHLTVKFDFCVNRLNGKSLNIFQNDKLKLSYYRTKQTQSERLVAGSRWLFNVKLKPNYGRLNPAGFDYEKWLLSEGYLATGYIKSATALKPGFGLKEYFHNTRQSIFDAVSRVSNNENTRGVILALAMGERSEITPTQWQFVVNSGTAHLLAISGLHIGIAAAWAYYLFLFIFKNIPAVTRRYSAQRLAETASLTSAFVVTLISGLGYPSQRALIMLTIFLICRWTGRNLSLANLLGLSVITITIIQPFAVMSVSFWLSVCAVAVIALVVSYKQQTNNKLSRIKAWLRFNWLLFLGLIPISWWFFGQFAVVGFLANVILIPITSFISAPLIYLALVALTISENLASMIFYLAEFAISLTLWLQENFASLNDQIPIASLTAPGALSLTIAILLFLVPKSFPGRSLAIPALTLVILTILNSKQQPQLKLVLFDVGHGLAINVSIGGKQLVYDTGFGRFVSQEDSNSKSISKLKTRLSSEYSVARSSLIPYLRKQGIVHIDKLIISHNDADHSGGFLEIIERFDIGELLLGELDFIKSKRLNQNLSDATIDAVSSCHHRDSWSWSGVSFDFITTPAHFLSSEKTRESFNSPESSGIYNYQGNNASCVLLITTESNKILIAGDIEKKVEKDLVAFDNQLHIRAIDILVAPHHGSETSSTEVFVNHTSPKLVLFSSGYANQWQFPRKTVTKRYQHVGAKLLTSFQTGAISILESRKGELLVETERSRRPRFWHRIQP